MHSFPKRGDRVKIHIKANIGGGYHIAKVKTIVRADDVTLMYCAVDRTFTKGKIHPPSVDILCIPTHLVEVWSIMGPASINNKQITEIKK